MGVDWRGLAMKLPQNYTKKIARKLAHSLACVSVLRHGSPAYAGPRLSTHHSSSHAVAKSKKVIR